MCGILGYIGNVPQEYNASAFKFLTSLFISSDIRGKDASGFAAIYGKSKEDNIDDFILTDKRPLKADNFIMDSRQFLSMRTNMPNIFIGHTRHSTSGTPSKNRNNHPFHNTRYSLVHNGSIPNWRATAARLKLDLRTDTDSEILIKLLNGPPKEAVSNIINEVDTNARIAISAIDRIERKLILCRTNNPTFFFAIKEWKSIFFASTEDIIKHAITLAGQGFSWLTQTKPLLTDADKIYKLGFSSTGNPHLEEELSVKKFIPPLPNKSETTHSSYVPSCIPKPPVNKLSNGDRTLGVLPVIKGLLNSPVMTAEEKKHFLDWYNND